MSVHLLKDGRWVCRYPKGKDQDRPTSTTKYFPRGVEGEAQARAYNASLGLSVRHVQTSPLFVELVNAYLGGQGSNITESTKRKMIDRLEGILLPEFGTTMVHNITPDRLDRYVAKRTQTVKLLTVHRELSDVRAVIRWAVARRLIAINPMDLFKFPSKDPAHIAPPSKAEFDALVTAAVPHLKRAMLISYYTGLRPGVEELLKLKWEAVDFINKTILVTSAKKKGIPQRVVPLSASLLSNLLLWYEEDKALACPYLVHYVGRRVDSLKTAWKNAKRRANITRRLRLYDLRHAFITALLERGADLKSVSEMAGHASPDLTMKVYQHCSSELKRKAIDLLD